MKQNIFGGNCPLWAELAQIQNSELDELVNFDEEYQLPNKNWTEYIIIDYKYERECKLYLAACFLSCIFGAVWLMLYFMCGKGGYDRGMQVNSTP